MSEVEAEAVSVSPQVRPRMVALDVDDTLLEADLTLSDACADALRRAQDQGVHVVLATGRMYCSVLPFAKRLQVDGYLITYNGGLVRSVEGETMWHKPVPREEARKMIGVAEREGLCLNLYIDDTLIVETLEDERVAYYQSIAGVDAVPVGDLAKALESGEPTKCLMVGEAERIPSIVPRLQAEFPNLQITRSKPRFIEVTQKGVHKEIGLVAVAEAYGLDMDAVMAIGDGENDATMLARAGWGVAVANASDGAKAAADFVTAGSRGAGVCEAIERFVLD